VRPEVELACPTCGDGLRVPLAGEALAADCRRCGERAMLVGPGGTGARSTCAACGAQALWIQRDFNRAVGLGVVAIAALLAVPTKGISLGVAALVDLALYRFLPRITVCYACDAIHRGVPVNSEHAAYDHHVEDGFKEAKSKRQVAIQAWRSARRGDRSPRSSA